MTSPKLYDKEDDKQNDADLILASMKIDAYHKRCRDRKARHNLNLSDIPENFPHVPASSLRSNSESRPPSLQTSQEYFGTRVRYKPPQKQVMSFMALMRWLRDRYIGCMRAVDGSSCDISGMSGYMMSRQSYVPPPASSRPV